MRRLELPAPLLVLASITSVQFGSAVATTLFDDLGAAGVTLLRLAVAAVVIAVFARPRLGGWSNAAWRAAAVLGVLMAGMNLVFYLALRTVPLGIAVTVEFLGPLLLALAQTRRVLDLLWALLAGAGVVLLGTAGGGSAPLRGPAPPVVGGPRRGGCIVFCAQLGGPGPGARGAGRAPARRPPPGRACGGGRGGAGGG